MEVLLAYGWCEGNTRKRSSHIGKTKYDKKKNV